jgi:hypothetical protein
MNTIPTTNPPQIGSPEEIAVINGRATDVGDSWERDSWFDDETDIQTPFDQGKERPRPPTTTIRSE